MRIVIVLFLWVLSSVSFAQGEDSHPWERDLQVIATMLDGTFSNANQAYFDQRVDRPHKHARMNAVVRQLEPTIFEVSIELDNVISEQRWQLMPDNEKRAVRMSILTMTDNAATGCDIYWTRSAGQFQGQALETCEPTLPTTMSLSADQLWLGRTNDPVPFQMHRARAFQCYADMPGVGGGRDIDYKRYDGFDIHDQGGEFWFIDKDGRELGASLLRVDWPINNLKGIFTRNSLVLYVNEKTEEGQKEISYTFTEASAERVGINLKWILVNCFMESNEVAIPSM
ncbi:MAG: hypothetical protein AB8F65_10970 [Woeseiaceae bacterium]